MGQICHLSNNSHKLNIMESYYLADFFTHGIKRNKRKRIRLCSNWFFSSQLNIVNSQNCYTRDTWKISYNYQARFAFQFFFFYGVHLLSDQTSFLFFRVLENCITPHQIHPSHRRHLDLRLQLPQLIEHQHQYLSL